MQDGRDVGARVGHDGHAGVGSERPTASDLREHVATGVRIERNPRCVPPDERGERVDLGDGEMRRADADRGDGSASDGRQLVAGGAQTLGRDDDLALRTPPPSAASSVGASGVIPTAWNIATAPEDAAAAPSAFSRSSLVPAGRPTMTGTRVPDSAPDDVTDARAA